MNNSYDDRDISSSSRGASATGAGYAEDGFLPGDRDVNISSSSPYRRESGKGYTDLPSNGNGKPPKKPKSKKKKVILAIILVIVLGLGCFAAWFAVPIAASLSAYERQKLDSSDLGFTSKLKSGVTNIALFGCDTRSGTDIGGRSDSIMILSINTNTRKIHIFSVMRDTLVRMDGYGGQKINVAYHYGKAQLAVKTLNESFGLDIDDFVSINFVGMAKVIDALGGIEATLTESEVKDANKHMIDQAEAESKAMGTKVETDYIKNAGTQLLSGMQAVAYARIRAVSDSNGSSGDFGRTDRQRFVLEQLYSKLREVKISEYDEYIDLLMPYIESSLGTGDVVKLAFCLAFMKFEIVQMRVPQTKWVISSGYSVKGAGSTVYYNLDFAGDVMRAMIYDNVTYEDYIAEHKIDKTKWY